MTARLPRIAAVAALAVAAIAAIVVLPGGGDRHTVRVLADEARFMRSGLEVRAAGRSVGKVVEAAPTRDGRAHLELRIDDDRIWPLPVGTRAEFRWAGTIAFTNRYVELDLPTRSGRAIPDGGVIPGHDVVPSVEFDEVARLFDRRTRRGLRATLDAGGRALGPVGPSLRRALDAAPAALGPVSGVIADLASDRRALDTLVRSTDRVVHAADAADPGAAAFLAAAGDTFGAVRRRTAALRTALERTPATLDATRSGLRQADLTLTAADTVLARLAPGVREVRRIAAPLRSVLAAVIRVAPDARASLATLGRATTDLDPLLDRARTLMPLAGAVGREASRQLECIRPYAPEAAGFFMTWLGFQSRGDSRDTYARVSGSAYPHLTSFNHVTAKEWTTLVPSLKFAFPRPPGYNAGQPQFDASCGVGRDALDPAKDREKIG